MIGRLVNRVWSYYMPALICVVIAATIMGSALADKRGPVTWISILLTVVLVLFALSFGAAGRLVELGARRQQVMRQKHKDLMDGWKHRPAGADNLRAANYTAHRFGYRSKQRPTEADGEDAPAA